MIHHIYTHNWQTWRNRVKKVNGALTYSEDICEWYLPFLENTVLEGWVRETENIVVSTCAPFSIYNAPDVLAYQGQYDVLVQFLHSYPKTDPLKPIQETYQRYKHKFRQFIFVTAYIEYAKYINDTGYNFGYSAKFLPMRIGKAPGLERKGRQKQQAVWFGNVYADKKHTYANVVKQCKVLKVDLITIREGKLYDSINPAGRSISQAQAWQVCANAGVVFAVGRCALEAYSMGCHVIIAGDSYGGVVTDSDKWNAQEATNFNGRIITGPYVLPDAIDMALMERGEGKQPYVNHDKILCESLVSSGLIQWK